jgi:hypothetical protein
MKDFVNQNTVEVMAAAEELRIEQNEPAGDRSRGKMGAERWAQLDANRAAGERWQH